MGVSIGPSTVTDSLLMIIDAANPKSYSGSGTTISDLVTKTFQGTFTDITVSNGNLNFNGTTSLINMGTLPSSLVDVFEGGGTIEAWIRPESGGVDSVSPRIADTTDGTVQGWLFYLSDESAGQTRLDFWIHYNGSPNGWETTDRVITNGEWHHIVLTLDSSSASNDPIYYVNGVKYSIPIGNLTQTNTSSGVLDTDSGNGLYIGNRTGAVRTFDGDINVVKFYDRILTEDEVVRNYRALRSRFGL